MGTWGTGILSDDTARDLYDEFVELYDAGIELSEIRRRIEEEYRASLEAMDEGPLVWLALAKGQWECDALDDDVLARIERSDWIITVFKRTPLDPNETPEPDAAWCLARSHHEEAAGLQIVGRTALRSTDPASGRRLAGWNFPRFAAIRRFKIPW